MTTRTIAIPTTFAAPTAAGPTHRGWSALARRARGWLRLALAGGLAALALGAAAAVDVNRADEAELQTVKGIGPALSTKILAARQQGAFKDWADLQQRVSGIGAGNSVRFSQAGLTVAGAAYSAAPAADKPAADKSGDKPAKAARGERAEAKARPAQ